MYKYAKYEKNQSGLILYSSIPVFKLIPFLIFIIIML